MGARRGLGRSSPERGCPNLERGAAEPVEGGRGGEGHRLDWASKNGPYSLQDAQTRSASVTVQPDLAAAHERVDYRPGAGLAAQFRSGYCRAGLSQKLRPTCPYRRWGTIRGLVPAIHRMRRSAFPLTLQSCRRPLSHCCADSMAIPAATRSKLFRVELTMGVGMRVRSI